MPTKRRPVRRRLALIPFMYRKWLLTGRPYALPYLEAERVAALWDEYGEAITARHIAKWPGSRPVNWHRYSSPERWNSSQETQLQFLLRLGLMRDGEQARVRRSRPSRYQFVVIGDRVEPP